MWHRKNNSDYEIPEKPKKWQDQVSMLWDATYNHIPGILKRQDRRLKWQDVKINFILAFVALILGALTIWTVYPAIAALLK